MSSLGQMQSPQMMDVTVSTSPALDCMQGSRNCPMPVEHMGQFFSVHPATLLDQLAFFLSLIVLSVIAWFFILKNYVADNERLRARLRSVLRSLKFSFTPSVLTFAFSQGILHPKRHA